MVIRELTESDLEPHARSAGNRDRFPILNVGKCDVHSDGQEGLLVQKLCNISDGAHFKEKQALSLANQKITADDEGGDFQASFQTSYGKQGVGQLKINRDISDTLWNINLNVPARSMKGGLDAL